MQAAFEIVASQEGRDRRRSLMDNILYMRAEMGRAGLETLGDPSPIVPVRVGTEGQARIASWRLNELGAIANLVEYRLCRKAGARFRVQVMANHTHQEIDLLIKAMVKAMQQAEADFRPYRSVATIAQPAQVAA